MGQHSQSLVLLNQARDLASSLFGPKHLVTGATLHQLTQAHFLAQDVPKAFECSVAALEIFEAELGKDNVQAKEIGKNVELLKAVMENAERQQQQSQQQRAEQLARLHTAQQRVTGTAQKKRAPLASSSSMPIPASAVDANGVPLADLPQPDVEELVKFIQGQASSSSKPRGKSALRGKKRTGAKR
jgi:protein TIF31